MPEYCSYNGAMRDPTEKYVIKSGGVDTYKRGGFFPSLSRWKFLSSFKIDRSTKILDEHVEGNGCGWVTLESGGGKRSFYVFKYARDFIRELKSHGFH